MRDPELISAFCEDIRQWAGPRRKIYWISDEPQIKTLKQRLAGLGRLTITTKIELPESKPIRPAPGANRQLPGMRNPGFALRLTGDPVLCELTLEGS